MLMGSKDSRSLRDDAEAEVAFLLFKLKNIKKKKKHQPTFVIPNGILLCSTEGFHSELRRKVLT